MLSELKSRRAGRGPVACASSCGAEAQPILSRWWNRTSSTLDCPRDAGVSSRGRSPPGQLETDEDARRKAGRLECTAEGGVAEARAERLAQLESEPIPDPE